MANLMWEKGAWTGAVERVEGLDKWRVLNKSGPRLGNFSLPGYEGETIYVLVPLYF